MIERENTPMTTSSDVIAGLELALASADAMIERLMDGLCRLPTKRGFWRTK